MSPFLISIFSCLFIVYIDLDSKKLLSLCVSPMLLLFGFSFIAVDMEFAKVNFEFATPAVSIQYVILFLSSVVGVSLGFIINNLLCRSNRYSVFNCEPKIILSSSSLLCAKNVFYRLSFFAIIAFFYNLYHGLVYLLNAGFVVDPRDYEAAFGSSTIVNYVYFLHVPALCLGVFIHHAAKFKFKFKFSKTIMVFLFASSFFHGIKFTFFDALMFPLLVHLILCKKMPWRTLVFSSTFLFLFLWLFFTFARGASDIPWYLGVVNYIVPNFFNMMYSIDVQPVQFNYYLDIVFPDKMPIPDFITPSLLSGFLLNDKYNMFTSFYSLYSSFGAGGGVFYCFVLVFIGVVQRKYHCRPSFFMLFALAYLCFCLAFGFYFWAFSKTKYIYLLFVCWFISRSISKSVKGDSY